MNYPHINFPQNLQFLLYYVIIELNQGCFMCKTEKSVYRKGIVTLGTFCHFQQYKCYYLIIKYNYKQKTVKIVLTTFKRWFKKNKLMLFRSIVGREMKDLHYLRYLPIFLREKQNEFKRRQIHFFYALVSQTFQISDMYILFQK